MDDMDDKEGRTGDPRKLRAEGEEVGREEDEEGVREEGVREEECNTEESEGWDGCSNL